MEFFCIACLFLCGISIFLCINETWPLKGVPLPEINIGITLNRLCISESTAVLSK